MRILLVICSHLPAHISVVNTWLLDAWSCIICASRGYIRRVSVYSIQKKYASTKCLEIFKLRTLSIISCISAPASCRIVSSESFSLQGRMEDRVLFCGFNRYSSRAAQVSPENLARSRSFLTLVCLLARIYITLQTRMITYLSKKKYRPKYTQNRNVSNQQTTVSLKQ